MAKTQKPINPFKVAGKMMKTSLSKTKQVLNKKKTANNSTNAAAGVVSRTGGVRTITNAKVTGSKQKGIEGLKAKKKSGEMSRAEANAKIKALKGKAPVGQNVTVTGKKQPVKPTYGNEYGKVKGVTGGRGKASTYFANPKDIPSDSAKFMQKLQTVDPAVAKKYMDFMKQEQTKNPGARFSFGPSVRGAINASAQVARPGETPKIARGVKSNGEQMYEYYVPRVRTVLPNKKKK